MVSGVRRKKSVVVKLADGGVEACATAKGGLGLAEALAQRLGLWSLCRRHVPSRRDTRQGFETTAVLSSVVYGLLSGGRGFSATEPLRGDAPLLKMVGLDAAPSAETVEEVVKYLGGHEGGAEGFSRLLERQCAGLLKEEKRVAITDADGWFVQWADGTLLEVEGKHFEGMKRVDGRWGLLLAACFAGPYMSACGIAGKGVGEQALVQRFLVETMSSVIRPLRLAQQTLVLLDSLHGDEPTLALLESAAMEGSHYVVGANKLVRVERELSQMPELSWREVKVDKGSRWERASVCTFWLQCEEWPHKRLCVGRRWKNKGEMLWNYSGVVTSLRPEHPRVSARMKREGQSFEEAVWRLYDCKQGRENQWKDMLIDLGMHHPPTRRPGDNSVFYAMGALALNLSLGVRRLTFEGCDRHMRLWRLRREVFDVAGRVMLHSRRAVVRVLDARERIVTRLQRAFARVACL